MTYIATCAACHNILGPANNLEQVDAIALAHDPHCTATDTQKANAAFEMRLRNFTAQEGITPEEP